MKKSLLSLLLLTGFLFCSCENSIEDGFDSADSTSGVLRLDTEVIFENEMRTPYQIELLINMAEVEYWQNTYHFTVSGSGILNVKYRNDYNQMTIVPSDQGITIGEDNYYMGVQNRTTGKWAGGVNNPVSERFYSINIPAAGSYTLSFDNRVYFGQPRYYGYSFAFVIPVMYVDAVMVYDN